MSSVAAQRALPAPLRVVIAILLFGTAVCLYKTVRGVMNTGINTIVLVNALPLIQVFLAIGLMRRMPAARIATMIWYAFTTLSSVLVLLTLMRGDEPPFARGAPAIVATQMVIIIAASLFGYLVLTRPTVASVFAPVD